MGSPACSQARRARRARSRTWPRASGPPTKATRSWPGRSGARPRAGRPRTSSTARGAERVVATGRSTMTSGRAAGRCRRGRRVGVDRGDQDALRPAAARSCSRWRPRGLASLSLLQRKSGEVLVVGGVLDAVGHVGEERVGDVEHHVGERAAGAGPELAGGLVADEAELGHRLLTRARVAALTRSGRLSTLETVPSETPARGGDVLDRRARSGLDRHVGPRFALKRSTRYVRTGPRIDAPLAAR